MEATESNSKRESDPQKCLWKTAALNMWQSASNKKYCSKNRKIISETYLTLCQTTMTEVFCKNSKWLKGINYFCRKNFITDV